jgi:hypothetical protein
MTLDFRQDSERSTEFWVFYPRYAFTKWNEIGRIVLRRPPRVERR